jgi:hypothetical protein
MAYETTEVPVARSQEAIRKLIMTHQGFGIAFVSDGDPTGEELASEGFHAKVLIDGKPYAVRIMAKVKKAAKSMTERQREDFKAKEERRIWRVLYYHLKSVFEAADSGVMEFRELMLPYLVTSSGETIAERIIPQIDAAISHPSRLLTGGQ